MADINNVFTELGNAQRLVARHKDEMRFCPQAGKFMVAIDGRWRWDDAGLVTAWQAELARGMWARVPEFPEDRRASFIKFCIESERAGKIAAAVTLAQTDQSIVIDANQIDASDFLFGVENGVVDLRSGELRPYSPGDLITKVSPVVYDPAASCPRWEEFLGRIMSGNSRMIEYIQRIAGLCATGVSTVQEFYIFYGSGANGKSTLLDTLFYILGNHAVDANESLLIVRRGGEEHPTELADLAGKRLVVASETESGGKLRIQLIKRMTGDARMKGRFMRQDFFTFDRKFKTILVTNHRPRIEEDTDAVWRRIRLIPFDVIIPKEERDGELLSKLKNDAAGILNWIIQGCVSWQLDGMRPPEEVLVATQDYRTDADAISDFFSTNTIIADFARASRIEIWGSYQSWAKANAGKDGLDRAGFYERVRRIDGIKDSEWRVDGKPVRGFTGIGLSVSTTTSQEISNLY